VTAVELMRIAAPVASRFFKEGHSRVYVVECCARVLVTTVEAKKCRTCGEVPEGFWLSEGGLKVVLEGMT